MKKEKNWSINNASTVIWHLENCLGFVHIPSNESCCSDCGLDVPIHILFEAKKQYIHNLAEGKILTVESGNVIDTTLGDMLVKTYTSETIKDLISLDNLLYQQLKAKSKK